MKDSADAGVITPIERVLLDGVVGMTSEIPLHPFLVLWTLQHAAGEGRFISLREAVMTTYQNAGQKFSAKISAFYVGFFATVISSVLGTIAFDHMKHVAPLATQNDFLQGLLTHAAAAIFWEPGERVAMLMQAQHHAESRPVLLRNTLRNIWREKGLHGFYRGALPGFCANSFMCGCAFWLQTLVLKCYSPERHQDPLVKMQTYLFAFMLSAWLGTPIEGIPTRVRLGQFRKTAPGDNTAFQAIKTIYALGGIKSFWRGAMTSVLGGAMYSAAAWGPDVASALLQRR